MNKDEGCDDDAIDSIEAHAQARESSKQRLEDGRVEKGCWRRRSRRGREGVLCIEASIWRHAIAEAPETLHRVAPERCRYDMITVLEVEVKVQMKSSEE